MTETPLTIREVSTREGYALWADSYDRQFNVLIFAEELYIDTFLARLPYTSALDVGTGTGRHALKLARRRAKVTALDQSPEMLAVARQSAEREGLAIDFQLGSIDDHSVFTEQQFDLLICGLMLCHVPNLQHAAQQFAHALRDGGYLLITDIHPTTVHDYGWRTELQQNGIGYRLPNMPHTRDSYLHALTNNGFTILEILDIPLSVVPWGHLSDEFMQENADKLLCLIILAQK